MGLGTGKPLPGPSGTGVGPVTGPSEAPGGSGAASGGGRPPSAPAAPQDARGGGAAGRPPLPASGLRFGQERRACACVTAYKQQPAWKGGSCFCQLVYFALLTVVRVESSRFFFSINGCPIFRRVVLAVWRRGHTSEDKTRLKQENMAGEAKKTSGAKRMVGSKKTCFCHRI